MSSGYQSPLARVIPTQMDTEQIKRNGWHQDGILVVDLRDPRLGWVDKGFVEQIGDKLYGRRKRG